MWDNKKPLKILKYYSMVSIAVCIFFVIEANNYFPPLTIFVNPTIKYLEHQKDSVSTKDEKEKLPRLIMYQEMILENDKLNSNIKFAIIILSILFIFISLFLYNISTKQLKLLKEASD